MLDSIERSLMWLSSFGVGGDTDTLCNLRAPIDAHTFVTDSNSLLTMYRVVGSKRLIGEDEFGDQAAALTRTLSGLLKSGKGGRQHSLIFGFRSSPAGGGEVLKKILRPSVQTARRFGADADFLFTDKFDAMSPHCVDELAVFGIVTHLAGLSPDEKKRWDEYRTNQFLAFAKTGVTLDGNLTQTPHTPPPVMYSRHQAAIQTAEEKFSNDGIGIKVMLDRLTCHEAVSLMRVFLDASTYQPDWRPQLLGDKPAVVDAKRSSRTFDLGFPLRIGRQLITEKLVEKFGDAEVVKRGKLWYGSCTLDVCPQEFLPMGFRELSRSIGRMIPYQINFDISPNGLEFNRMESLFASFMGGAGDHNKMIKAAYDQLKEMKNNGEYVASVRAVFTTWAKSESECVDNVSFLKSKVEGWGQAVATNESGAPAHTFVASVPGFSRTIPATHLPGPLSIFSRMMPMFAPSSVWKAGQLVLFTEEGRPYPIALGTTLQNYWGTLVFAPTGSGKSFLMNMLNAGVMFTPGATKLPMVTIIDKGPSAKGVVMLAKAVLPPHLADQVVYWRPTPSDITYCVNPMDTQPGCDKPLESDRDFIMALLGGICPNLGTEGGQFIGRVIDVAYETFSRISPNAKRWQWNTDVKLSEKLASVGIDFSEEKPPRVWDVVDAFFDKGMVDESMEAQFHAMPVLPDLTRVLQDQRVLGVYGEAPAPSGEKMVKVFERALIAASSEYKLFSGITRHRANARFKVIDIDGMAAASSSEEGRRRFALMLLFARRLGAREFFLHPDDVKGVAPAKYLPYLMDRAQKVQEELKFLEYDEIHNAKGIDAVQQLLQKDAREGRKYNVVGILSSQDLDDFPPDLVKNCYNFFVLGAGSAQAGKDLQRTFDLSNSEVQTVMTQCTKPGILFGMFRTNRGLLSQLLFTKPGSREIWAYNTSAVDMALRDELYGRIGVRNALGFLATQFPAGSARTYIEVLRRDMSAVAASDDSMTSVVLDKLSTKLSDYLAKQLG
jgi:intracellular multiplication protein IcmB